MKKIKFLHLVSTVLIGLALPALAGPHGGGGGFAGGGFSAGGGGHFSGYSGGGLRTTPAFSAGGARISGRSIAGLSRPPQQFYYYNGARTAGLTTQHAFVRQVPNRLTSPNLGRVAAVNRQAIRVNSTVGQKRVLDPRLSTAQNRQSFMKNHAFARHDSNWHRDWDKHRAHFHNNRVFVFNDGFWWGLYPWDYYPYYGYDYPYDYDNGYPYDYYNGYPYDYYNGYYPNDYYQDSNDNDSTNAASDQYPNNPTVSAVQSKLAKLGYYRGAIDGVVGDETQAALARYQEDHDLSVTGTLTAASLRSLGLARTASLR